MMDPLLDRLGGRDRVIRILMTNVIVGVLVWIVTDAVFYLGVFGSGASFGRWLRWSNITARVAYDVWLGSLALLLLIWLSERLSNSAPPSSPDPN